MCSRRLQKGLWVVCDQVVLVIHLCACAHDDYNIKNRGASKLVFISKMFLIIQDYCFTIIQMKPYRVFAFEAGDQTMCDAWLNALGVFYI